MSLERDRVDKELTALVQKRARMSSLSSNDMPICADQRGSTTGGGNENKQECISYEQKNDDNVGASCELLNDMSISDNNNIAADSISTCANCGKEGSDVTNTCNKCKSVMYCNAACKKKHRHKHKKHCEEHLRLAADRAAELHDEALFKQPPPQFGDCPICMIRLPSLDSGSSYYSCCGKTICSGCFYANARIDDNKHKQLCTFCRIPAPTSGEEAVKRLNKRVDVRDAEAMFNRGCEYRDGDGFPQDHTKALELYQRAGELGFTKSYCSIGYAYSNGRGVEVDKKKAQHYYELAAMGGNVNARHNLGNAEYRFGNMDRAIKHYMIAVNDGSADSLQNIQMFYSKGHATKDVYTAALQSYQEYLCEIKSVQRDEAATYSEDFKYY